MTTTWAHLPNAHHIDRILAHLRAHPQAWADAYPGWSEARAKAWDVARTVVRAAGRDDAYVAARDAARSITQNAEYPAYATACDAFCALIAWDDCADLLSLPEGALREMRDEGHYSARLLLPAVVALTGDHP